MTPKNFFTFLIMEFVQHKGLNPSFIGQDTINYKHPEDNIEVKFERKEFQLPLERVEEILNHIGSNIDELKEFVESMHRTGDFEKAIERAVIKPPSQ